jgi:energy-coupling factor transporter ATP-binding protein EcfA2
MQHFTRVTFHKFKAFPSFILKLKSFNIMVGPNNAGKSTIVAAFRILAAGLRRANAKRASLIQGPNGPVLGYQIELDTLSVAGENVFFNYDDTEAAFVKFDLSDERSLTLYFPEQNSCYLIPDALGKKCDTPKSFRELFNCPIGFVPVLGPVDQIEHLYNAEAARLALFNYRAARNFRNIWWHFPESFDEFRDSIKSTWPGMDVKRPELDTSGHKAVIRMFCPEDRIDREIFWSGFGFQVWCQMLTHLIQSKKSSIFLIDEPDIYLHSDLQRQLVSLLRVLGPDILIATHSTEIITEAEADEIIIVNKKKKSSKRISNQSDVEGVFRELGSNVNPILTQLGKTKKVVFVEGKDFQIISKFARKIGKVEVANRGSFAVIPMEGFNPDRAKILKEGIELTLGTKIRSTALLDRDYRSNTECNAIEIEASDFCDIARIHHRKEIENFLLIPTALDRAIQQRVIDRLRRTGEICKDPRSAQDMIDDFATNRRQYIMSRHIAQWKRYQKKVGSKSHEDSLTEDAIKWFDIAWSRPDNRLNLIPGKDALSAINQELQRVCSISIAPSGIVSAMTVDEIPREMRELIDMIEDFATRS